MRVILSGVEYSSLGDWLLKAQGGIFDQRNQSAAPKRRCGAMTINDVALGICHQNDDPA
jgi:hypothetical protein